MPDYDFEKFLKGDKGKVSKEEARNPEEAHRLEDIRPNLHVTSCCGNCKYFWYGQHSDTKTNRRLGFCKQPNPGPQENVARPGKYGKVDKEYAEKYWLKTHITLKCDLYERRDKFFSIDTVAKWIRTPIKEDGTVMNNEEDLD